MHSLWQICRPMRGAAIVKQTRHGVNLNHSNDCFFHQVSLLDCNKKAHHVQMGWISYSITLLTTFHSRPLMHCCPRVVYVLTFFSWLLHDKPVIIMPVGLFLLNASLVFLVELRACMLHVLKVRFKITYPFLSVHHPCYHQISQNDR